MDDKKYMLYCNDLGKVYPLGGYDSSGEAMRRISYDVKWERTPEWSGGEAWIGISEGPQTDYEGKPVRTFSIFYESPQIAEALKPRAPSFENRDWIPENRWSAPDKEYYGWTSFEWFGLAIAGCLSVVALMLLLQILDWLI
jgi:hypothetical protein